MAFASVSSLLKAPTMLEQLLEEINFQRTKEMRQLLKDGECCFIYWTWIYVAKLNMVCIWLIVRAAKCEGAVAQGIHRMFCFDKFLYVNRGLVSRNLLSLNVVLLIFYFKNECGLFQILVSWCCKELHIGPICLWDIFSSKQNIVLIVMTYCFLSESGTSKVHLVIFLNLR